MSCSCLAKSRADSQIIPTKRVPADGVSTKTNIHENTSTYQGSDPILPSLAGQRPVGKDEKPRPRDAKRICTLSPSHGAWASIRDEATSNFQGHQGRYQASLASSAARRLTDLRRSAPLALCRQQFKRSPSQPNQWSYQNGDSARRAL